MITLTIGLTESDREANYSSFSDGYRPGAAQVTVTLALSPEQAGDRDPAALAEAVFVATNTPYAKSGLEGDLQEELAPERQTWMRSLSVGDTVTVTATDGTTTVLAVDLFGFKDVTDVFVPREAVL